MAAAKQGSDTVWVLPPLILHPFSNALDPVRMLAGTTTAAIAPREPPPDRNAAAHVRRKLLLAKYCEIRMLWCIGKDLLRWIDQCLDFVGRRRELRQAGITAQSLAALLIDNTPAPVAEKLRAWGVTDYRNIFARALGLDTVFSELPPFTCIAEEFLLDYYTYTFELYRVRQRAGNYPKLEPSRFAFEVYTSGEYIQIIERQMSQS